MSATVSRPVAACWLHLLLQRRPHQVVGPTHAPHVMRWFVLPHNRFANVHVQIFTARDSRDHPWWFASLVTQEAMPNIPRAGRAHAGAQVRRCGRHRFSIASNYPQVLMDVVWCAERWW
jgi:hypothetical protein